MSHVYLDSSFLIYLVYNVYIRKFPGNTHAIFKEDAITLSQAMASAMKAAKRELAADAR